MEVFRLSREKFAASLSGKGAALKGGRWNSPGVEMIYTAQNRSLAMAEVAVHFTLATLPDDYKMITILIPDHVMILEIKERILASDWRNFPHPVSTQIIGNTFIEKRKASVLKVPSAITKGDFNFLINPYHEDFKKIKIVEIESFPFDSRIVKK
ncbi:MAG: RES family NAD+ phosphorylase [Saprospiraceae bacterium]|nr:RES family NAD+ phosphorylase [Saprospiraceae bacterium]